MITKLKIAIVFILLKIYEALGAYCLICVLPYMVGCVTEGFMCPQALTNCFLRWMLGVFSLFVITLSVLLIVFPCMIIWLNYPRIYNTVVNWVDNNWDKARDIVNKN